MDQTEGHPFVGWRCNGCSRRLGKRIIQSAAKNAQLFSFFLDLTTFLAGSQDLDRPSPRAFR